MSSRRIPRVNQVNYGLHLINNQISPMINSNYEAQLAKKQSIVKDVLKVLGKKLISLNRDLTISPNGLPCTLEAIRKSPSITNYRNKDEFSVWPGKDGITPIVGFLSDSLAKATTHCVEPDLTVTSKDSHKDLAKRFQQYIQTVTPLQVCTRFDQPTGNWRRFVVRSNRENQLMAICVLHPKVLTPNELNDEKRRLIDFFNPIAEELSLCSLYFQACCYQRCDGTKAPYQLLFGRKTISETLFGYKFEISPDSFFQVNTEGTEVLYQSIIDRLKLDQNTVVIDLNCEIGSAIIPIAHKVKKIYGIDSSLSAVDFAYQNARSNGITNCQFFRGDLHNLLPELFKKLSSEENVVIIAKPKRGGYANSVLSLLREFDPIKQIAYLSSKPVSMNAISNFVHLCQSFRPGDGILGGHFAPISAIPVDLFPQTNHLELVFIFERDEIILFK